MSRPLITSSCAGCGRVSLGSAGCCSRCLDRVRYLPSFRASSPASDLAQMIYGVLVLVALVGALWWWA